MTFRTKWLEAQISQVKVFVKKDQEKLKGGNASFNDKSMALANEALLETLEAELRHDALLNRYSSLTEKG